MWILRYLHGLDWPAHMWASQFDIELMEIKYIFISLLTRLTQSRMPVYTFVTKVCHCSILNHNYSYHPFEKQCLMKLFKLLKFLKNFLFWFVGRHLHFIFAEEKLVNIKSWITSLGIVFRRIILKNNCDSELNNEEHL